MRYSRVLASVMGVYAVVVVCAYVAYGDNALVNGWTVALAIVMATVFACVLLTTPARSADLEIMFVSTAALYLCPPVVLYLAAPAWFPFGNFDGFVRLGVDDVNRALLFVNVGTLVAVAGMRLAALVMSPRPRRERSVPKLVSVRGLIVLGVTYMAIELFIGFRFHRFSTDIGDSQGPYISLIRLISFGSVSFIGVVVGMYHWRELKLGQRAALVGSVPVVVAYWTLGGSRQAFLTLLVLCLAISLDRFGDFKISRRAFVIVFLGGIASVMAYPVATTIREYWNYSERGGHYLSWAEFKAAEEEMGNAVRTSGLPFLIGSRLNGLDPIAVIAAGHSTDKARYVSVKNDIESFINIVVPGTPFPEARERSKTFLIVYRGYPKEYLDQFYVTSMWTLWGDSYALFGFYGGLVWMFVLSAGVTMAFSIVSRRARPTSGYFRLLFLNMIYYLTLSFGLDTVGATAVYLAIPLTLTLLALGAFRQRTRGSLRRYSSRAQHLIRVSKHHESVMSVTPSPSVQHGFCE